MVTNGIVKNTDYNAKITEIDGKIPDISNLTTKTALSTVENKIPDTSGLAKKTDYDSKNTDIEGKIPNISNLATKTVLITVENKMPLVALLKKEIMTLKLQKLKIKLIIKVLINILILKSLIN